jgi:hypothetical protein
VATQSDLDRLTADLRVFDVNGIERAAWGWDRHERRGLDRYHDAERAALAQIEKGALVTWKSRHGPLGHKAESAAFGAALGLFAREHLTREQYADLVEPMAEALPWLLPDRAPAPRTP